MESPNCRCVLKPMEPLWKRKWWTRWKDVPGQIPLAPDEYRMHSALQQLPAARRFYVPLWAWPLELLHRVIFGYPSLLGKPDAVLARIQAIAILCLCIFTPLIFTTWSRELVSAFVISLAATSLATWAVATFLRFCHRIIMED